MYSQGVGPVATDYAEKIRAAHVARKGEDDEPWLHEHAIEEAELCTDCDAYLAMQAVEDEEDE